MAPTRNKRYFDPGMILITLGGFLLAMAPLKSQIDTYYILSANVYNLLIVLSIVIFLIGGFLVLLSYYTPSSTTTFVDYDVEIAKHADLSILHGLCCKMLGESVVSLNTMARIYKRNENVFSKVIEVKTKGTLSTNRIVGFFDILPLDQETSEQLKDGLINSGSLLLNKVLKKNEIANSIYIGGVFATDYKAKAATLAFLKSSIHAYIKQGVKTIYARPTTDIGLRLVINSGFAPIDNVSENHLNIIYYKDV